MADAAAASAEGEVGTREQDRFLPIANISRIMKKALPPNAKIAKDAKETVRVLLRGSVLLAAIALAPSSFPRPPRAGVGGWVRGLGGARACATPARAAAWHPRRGRNLVGAAAAACVKLVWTGAKALCSSSRTSSKRGGVSPRELRETRDRRR